MSIATAAIRMLRRCPRTASFDRHLDDCAALALFHSLGEDLPPLRAAHVLRLVPVPSLYPAGTNAVADRVQEPVLPDNVVSFRRRQH